MDVNPRGLSAAGLGYVVLWTLARNMLKGYKVSMFTHTYQHKLLKEIARLKVHFMGIKSDDIQVKMKRKGLYINHTECPF